VPAARHGSSARSSGGGIGNDGRGPTVTPGRSPGPFDESRRALLKPRKDSNICFGKCFNSARFNKIRNGPDRLQSKRSWTTFGAMKLLEESYTARQVHRCTGVSYETLNYWARVGLVKPSVSAAQGSGTRRLYDFQDLVAIRVALKLRRAGVFGKALADVIGALRQAGFDEPARVTIEVTAGGEVVVRLASGQRVSARRRPGQLSLDFDCDCREELLALRHVVDQEFSGQVQPARKGVKKEEYRGAQNLKTKTKA
jgi:DNA-binding transcriptional MerR regulator